MDAFIPLASLAALGQPRLGSVYSETGTEVSGYEEHGPYHCEDCIHKMAADEPFCIHPLVLADPKMQDRIVLMDNRPIVKIDMKRGCCKYVNQPLCDEDDDDEETHE